MAGALPKVDRAFLSVLVRGAEKMFDNAEKLYFEAELLAKASATARALCLHQISLEECSKIENMGAWATSLLSGIEVDQNKNSQAIPAMPMSQTEIDAGRRRDRAAKDSYFGKTAPPTPTSLAEATSGRRRSFMDWLFGRH